MEITKTNNIITFKESVNDKKEVPVSLLQDALITKSGGVVIISYKYGDIKIDYTEVTTPVVTSADTLIEELKTLIGESSNGLNYEYTDNKSTSVLTDGLSDLKYPSVKAVKDYVDDSIAGLLDYRGGFDASLGTFPTVGGSGTAGAIKKGDAFVISSSGTLDSILVSIGDFIVAKIDNATDSSADWDILSGSVAYTPENAANKVTGVNVNSTDDQYPSAKAMYTALQGKVSTANHALSINGQDLTIVGGNTVTLPQATLPYKSYVAILRQTNSAAPSEDFVLENTIGVMTISRTSAGIYEITCPQFVMNKTVVVNPTFYFKGIGSGFSYYDNSTSIFIYTKNETGNFADLNQIMWYTIEVRVYN